MKILVIGATLSTRRVVDELLRHAQHQVVAIFTLGPEHAASKSRFVPLDDVCATNGIELNQVRRISDQKVVDSITHLCPDLIIESGWSQIIPSSILSVPKKGCIGLHYAWLPDYRGRASLNWALIRGEKNWGVSLFYLVEQVDAGGIIDRRRFAIEDRDDINTLYDKADSLGVQMIGENLPAIESDEVIVVHQSTEEGLNLSRRRPKDGEIDWTQANTAIHNMIRAIAKPFPGAYTSINGRRLYIWESLVLDTGSGPPGTISNIVDGRGVIAHTGNGNLLITRAQIEDGIEKWADDLAHEIGLKSGDGFD